MDLHERQNEEQQQSHDDPTARPGCSHDHQGRGRTTYTLRLLPAPQHVLKDSDAWAPCAPHTRTCCHIP